MLNINFIGRVTTEFPEKFGVPKQPQLIPLLRATIQFNNGFQDPNYLKGLESCSHVWVLFYFHLNKGHTGATIRPPLLGGDERMGIFSTRSPHRPNPIGLSLLKIISIDFSKCEIYVSGHDLVDGTPIIDIKPYVQNHDQPKEESFHWSDKISQAPIRITWNDEAIQQLSVYNLDTEKKVIEEILSLDPRPRSKGEGATFGFFYKKLNIVFSGNKSEIVVLNIIKTI